MATSTIHSAFHAHVTSMAQMEMCVQLGEGSVHVNHSILGVTVTNVLMDITAFPSVNVIKPYYFQYQDRITIRKHLLGIFSDLKHFFFL